MTLFSNKRNYQTHFLPEVNKQKAQDFRKDFAESFLDEWHFQTYTGNSYSRTDNLHDEFEKDIEEIEKITGEKLKNPYNSAFKEFFVEDVGMGIVNQFTKNPFNPKSSRFHPENVAKREQEKLNNYYKKANELKAKYPELKIRDIETIKADIAAQAMEYYNKVNDGRENNGWGSFLGSAAGSIIDPINLAVSLISGGGGSAKDTVLKSLSKTALGEFVANAAAEIGIQTAAYKYKKELGVPTSVEEAALNVAAAGVGGAVLGVAGKGIHLTSKEVLSRYKKAVNKGIKFDGATKEAAERLEQQIEFDDWVDETNPFSSDIQGTEIHKQNVLNEMLRMTEEQDTLSKAYDSVLQTREGDAMEELAQITNVDMEKIWVNRGGFKSINEVKGSGFGMVKFIFRHGEKSNDAVKITKEDVVNFPDVIKNNKPRIEDQYGTNRIWSVKRSDGKQIIYADRVFVEDGKRHLVTINVLTNEKHPLYGKFSEKYDDAGKPTVHTKDTAQEPFFRTDESSAEASAPKSRFQGGGVISDNIISTDDLKVKDFQDVSIENLENDLIQRTDLSPEDMDFNKQALQKMKDEEAWDNEILDCIVEFSKR